MGVSVLWVLREVWLGLAGTALSLAIVFCLRCRFLCVLVLGVAGIILALPCYTGHDVDKLVTNMASGPFYHSA